MRIISARAHSPKIYPKKIEEAIESDAKYLITYFPREHKYLDYMRNFASEVMPSFTYFF
jgi:hypothetical protein